MNIAYASFCQTCKAAGKDSRLHRDLSAPETIFCNEGHKFSGPEIEDYLTAEPTPDFGFPGKEPPEFVVPPAPAVEQLARELQEAMERTSPFELSPPPTTSELLMRQQAEQQGKPAPDTALSAMADEIRAKEDRGIVIKAPQAMIAVAEPEPAARPAPATPVDPHKPRKPVKSLPGGALEITVIISDPSASYLIGEAEFRGKTVQEHFQEMVDYGLDARWFF